MKCFLVGGTLGQWSNQSSLCPPNAQQEIEKTGANFAGHSLSQEGYPYKSFPRCPLCLHLPSLTPSSTLTPVQVLPCTPQLPGPHHPPVALFRLSHLSRHNKTLLNLSQLEALHCMQPLCIPLTCLFPSHHCHSLTLHDVLSTSLFIICLPPSKTEGPEGQGLRWPWSPRCLQYLRRVPSASWEGRDSESPPLGGFLPHSQKINDFLPLQFHSPLVLFI